MANSLSYEKRLVKNQENLKHSTCFTAMMQKEKFNGRVKNKKGSTDGIY